MVSEKSCAATIAVVLLCILVAVPSTGMVLIKQNSYFWDALR